MARILIAPFSRMLETGKPNPKNWPHWYRVCKSLELAGHQVYQTGQDYEPRVCSEFVGLLPQKTALLDLRAYDLCLCVDTWLQHAARAAGVPCVVVWTATDPAIYSHAANVNVIAAEPRYAKLQYAKMEELEKAEPGMFPGPTPEAVLQTVLAELAKKETKP